MRKACLVVAILLVPTLLAVASTAAAQASVVEPRVQVRIEDPARSLVPSRNETIPGRVDYQVPPGAVPAPRPDGGREPTRITFEILQTPSWVLDAHVFPPVVELVLPTNVIVGTTMQGEFSINLTLDPAAPALKREAIVVLAIVEPNGNINGASAENPSLNLRAAFVPLLEVTAASHAIVGGGRWTSVAFDVTNHGNADVVAKLSVPIRPEFSQIRFPDRVSLAVGETATVEVEIRMPWTEAEAGALALSAISVFNDDEEGPAAMHEVEVSGRSAVPGPGFLGLLVAIGVVLRVLRRSD